MDKERKIWVLRYNKTCGVGCHYGYMSEETFFGTKEEAMERLDSMGSSYDDKYIAELSVPDVSRKRKPQFVNIYKNLEQVQ